MAYKVDFNINAECSCDEFAIIPNREELTVLEHEVESLLMDNLQINANVRITIQNASKIDE